MRFERPNSRPPGGDGGESSSFDLLGFTHYWGKSRKGGWVVKRKTMMARLSRTLKRISMWCSAHRHLPIKEQHAALSRKLRGHDAYHGITGNVRRALAAAPARASHLAQVAQPTIVENSADSDTHEPTARGIPLPPARVRTLGLSLQRIRDLTNRMRKSARPGPWEPWGERALSRGHLALDLALTGSGAGEPRRRRQRRAVRAA